MTAWTKTFHDVTESGTVNAIVAEPSAPVRRCGCQKAVSEKLLRTTGAGGSPLPVVATAAVTFCFSSSERESTSLLSFASAPSRSRSGVPVSLRAAFMAIGAGAEAGYAWL